MHDLVSITYFTLMASLFTSVRCVTGEIMTLRAALLLVVWYIWDWNPIKPNQIAQQMLWVNCHYLPFPINSVQRRSTVLSMAIEISGRDWGWWGQLPYSCVIQRWAHVWDVSWCLLKGLFLGKNVYYSVFLHPQRGMWRGHELWRDRSAQFV